MYEIFQLQHCILNQFICGRVIQLQAELNTVSFLVVRSFGGNSSRREVNESVGFTVLMMEGSGKGVVTPNPPSHRYIELSSFISLCLTQVDDRSPCRLHPSSPVCTSAPLLSYANEGDPSSHNGGLRVYTHRCA